MDGATGGHATLEGGADLFGETGHGFMDTGGGGGGATLYRQECLADGDSDLVVIVAHYLAVALDHAQLAGGGVGNALVLAGVVVGLPGRGLWVLAHIRVHGALSVMVLFCLLSDAIVVLGVADAG